jgi:hypothetical protein
MSDKEKIDLLRKTLARASKLASIAYDWDLGTDGQVEIDDEWVSCADLHQEFDAVLEKTK